MEKQQGFTLVELVVVIIILGILAVTAAPKFINMQSDAYASTLKGVQGAINGANVMVYGKSALEGKNKLADQTITLTKNDAGNTVTSVKTNFGYVKGTKTDIVEVAQLDENEWIILASDSAATLPNMTPITPPGTVRIQQKNAPSTCYIEYKEATSAGTQPTFNTNNATADKC